MFAKSRRRLASAFGLTLTAVLASSALAASAAQATPTWHINGKSFAELGITAESFKISGSGSNEFILDATNGNFKVRCLGVTGSGQLKSTGGTATLTAEPCVMSEASHCLVSPIKMEVNLGFAEGKGGNVIETFKPKSHQISITVEDDGTETCWWYEGESSMFTGESWFGVEITNGPEAKELALAGSQALAAFGGFGVEPVYAWIEGGLVQQLTGGSSGKKFGAW